MLFKHKTIPFPSDFIDAEGKLSGRNKKQLSPQNHLTKPVFLKRLKNNDIVITYNNEEIIKYKANPDNAQMLVRAPEYISTKATKAIITAALSAARAHTQYEISAASPTPMLVAKQPELKRNYYVPLNPNWEIIN